jgi:nucleoside 2-deoxyribosyltransferase
MRKDLKCYIAGPLFSEQDRKVLETIALHVESRGVSVYLPHRDGGDLGTIILDQGKEALRGSIFRQDLEGIAQSNFIVCLLDGQDSDSGTSVEIGVAFERGIPIFGLKTDLERRGSIVNNMVWGVCGSGKRIFMDLGSLLSALDELLELGQQEEERDG